jgi:CUE domain
MKGSDHSDHVNELLLEWKSLNPIPSPIQLYRLGLLLEQLSTTSLGAGNDSKLQLKVDELAASYQAYLMALSENYCAQLFTDLVHALTALLQKYQKPPSSSGSITTNDASEALGSLMQLYNYSDLAAGTCAKDWSSTERLSVLVDCYYSHANHKKIRNCILCIASHFVRQSTLRSFFELNWEFVVPVLHWMQQPTSIAGGSQVVWDDVVSFMDLQDARWKDTILRQWEDQNSDASQPYLSYVQSLLSTGNINDIQAMSSSSDISIWNTSRTRSRLVASTRKSPEQEIQDRIDQVRSILPHFGEGFVETALSCFQGNVEQTVSALMDDVSNWPVTLQRTDRSLPRRLIKSTPQEDVEAKAITKAIIKANDQQAELEARMLEMFVEPPASRPNIGDLSTLMNEYDDDYDDQYDDVDGVVTGNVDVELYDSNNYDAIRSYNRTLKQVETEQRFWSVNRNTNYASSSAIKSEETNTEERKYRGPDLMRGGRTPGGRGGGRNSRNHDSDATTAKQVASGSSEPNGDINRTSAKPNHRQKARVLEKRRDQQKKAQMKRTGV